MAKQRIALRIDDIGASSKRYEVYSDKQWNLAGLRISANWLFLKYLPAFRRWGPYREMRAAEWFEVFQLLEQENAKLTVGITASWVESEEVQIPFPDHFPEEAAALKEGVQQNLLEIANHGLTHCVVAGKAFRPKWFAGNREQHREFWDWLPTDVHENHIRRSQDILQSYFGIEVVTLVPPGNVYSLATLVAARKYGIRQISCSKDDSLGAGLQAIEPGSVIAFHDRELVLEGIEWLERLLSEKRPYEKVFVRDLANLDSGTD